MGETMFKSGRKKGFIVLYRDAAQDDRLSLEARGLFALMVSLPENWEYTVSGLAVKAGCGRDKVRRLLRELQAVGYLTREQSHDQGGKFSANVYILQDEAPLPEKPSTVKPSTEKPLAGFLTQKNKDLKEYEIKNNTLLFSAQDAPEREEPAPENVMRISEAVKDFVNRVNPSAPYTVLQEIAEYEKTLGTAVCKRAFDIALGERKTNWSYIRGILRNCQSRGIRCLSDWDAADTEHEKQKLSTGKKPEYRGRATKTTQRSEAESAQEIRKNMERTRELLKKMQEEG